MVRDEYPDLTIIAGNVATGDMVQELILYAKVDIVKCGIGSGALCITRTKTGLVFLNYRFVTNAVKLLMV